MAKEKTARASFSLRLQPYEGSLLAEVVHYLNSLDRAEATRRVESVLVMAMLAQARLYDESRSDEERRRCCIESCDALDKHASSLRQLVGVERPMRMPSYEVMPTVQEKATLSTKRQMGERDLEEGENDVDDRPPPKAKLKALADADDVDALFGG